MKANLYPSFFSKTNRSRLLLCGVFLGLLFMYGNPTFAQITISEDFDYGTTSGDLTNQNGGTGFAAAWSGGTGAYTATGLSFGGLTSPGGAMIVASGSDARRQITTGFDAAGPISGSFLFKLNAAPVSSSVLKLGLGTNASTNNQNHYLGFLPANDGQLGKPALGVRGTGISAMTGGAALTTGTTYLYAFSYDNGSTSAWILSLAQYNIFFNGTTLDQTAMNAATIGSAATNVTGKVTVATNSSNLTTMNYLFSYFFSNGSLTVDRVRMSGTAALGGLGSATTSYTFNGTNNTDWATASNWSGAVVPTSANLASGDAVVIASNCTITGGAISFPSGTSLTINASTTFTMTSTPTITIQSGATLTINGTLTANNGTLNNAGTMNTASTGNFSNPSGSFNNSGTFNHSGTSTSTYGGFTNTGTINNSGTLNSSQYINVQNNGTFTNNSGGSVQFNGFINAANKTITNNGSMAAALDNAGTFINNNTFSFNYLGVSNRSGATLTNSTGATMALGLLAFSNSGTFNNNGTYSMTQGSGLASFANTSTGIITNTGTMTIGASVPATNAGTITNETSSTFTNNGTLSGAGTLTNNGTYKGAGTYSGSLFTNPNGSFVAPGNSPGCHTFSNGYTNNGTLQIELGGTTACTQYDRLNITGTATLGGTLDVSLINSYTGSNGHQLTIINATTLSGTFSTVNLPANWYINYNLPSAGQVTLSYNAPITAGAALSFDGTNDYVSVPDANILDFGASLTLEAWVKPASFNSYNIIIDKRTNTDATANYGLTLTNGKPMFYFWTNSSDSRFHTAPSAISLNTWSHIAATYDGAKVKLYVNGVLVYSQAETQIPPSTNQPLSIGRNPSSLQYFNGAIDEVRIWNTVRTCDQIGQQYNCELVGNESGLVAYYKFNQGAADSNNSSISSLTDATANGNHGTFNNFALSGSTSNFIATGSVTTGTSCPTVVAPEIDLQGGTPLTSISSGDSSPATADGTDLGNVLVNGSLTRTFTILNTGNNTLTITDITSNNTKFTISNKPTSVAANSSATFDVVFNPTATGAQNATIAVTNNDCDEALYNFAVTGAGAATGAALHFDGSNDLITASGLLPTPPTQFTVEFWLKPESLSDYNQEISIGSASSGHWNGFAFHTTANGSVYVGTDITSRMTPANIPANTVVLNTWQHFAYVYNNGTGYFYKNGVLLYTKGNSAPPSFDVLRIGSGCCLPIKGALDELRIWNTARTCEQISQQRSCELTGTEANLVAYYPFNQGFADSDNSGTTTLNDLATTIGGANNGTLTGFALTGTTSNWIAAGGVISGTNCLAVVAPEINVQGGSPLVSILNGSTSTSTANHTDFGSVNINSALERTFTIQNTGNEALTLTNITSNNATFVVSNVPTTVAANSLATFTVTFTPTATGAQNATITVLNNDCDEANYTFTISGTGSCVAPSFSVCPTNQTANTAVGGCTATVNYTATATGNPTPTISYVFTGATVGSGSGTGSGAVFNKGITTVTLSATNGCGNNATCTFNVTVNDTEAPVLNCPSNQTMTVASGSCTADYTIADPLSDNCSGATWGYTLSGATTKTISGVADGAGSGAISFNVGTTTVTLTGTDGTNSAVGCTFTVTVNAPEINVKGKGQDIVDGTTGTSELNDTNFGTTSGAALTRTFTIQNTGTAPLTISAITSSNTKFKVSELSSPSPLSSGNSATFTVTFSPNSITTQTSVISIINDDCNESTYDFEVSATSTSVNANALHFDGYDDLIEVPMPTPLFGTNSTTVEFWAKGAPNFSFPINFTGSGTTIILGPTLALAVYGDNTYFTGYPIEDCWHHYAFTYNGATSTVYAYVDGQPTPTASFQGNFPTVSTNMWLGSRAGSYPWNGTMDELRVWNVQRTQAQIQANLFNELAGNESGLVAYYNFNQGTAGGDNTGNTSLFDAQTNGTARTGTMTGFALNGTTSNWIASGGLQHYPEIDIQGNTTSIVDGDTSPADTDHTSFGDVFIGNSLVRTFTIKNTGTKELNIGSIGSSNSLFTVGSLSTASPLAVNASATFTVTFTPTALGAQSATITVNNDDCNEAVYDFEVSGLSSCTATATISGTNSAICVGNNAVFTLTGTNGAIVTYNVNGGSNATTTLTGGTATVTISGVTANQTLNLVSVNDGTCTLNLSASATVTVKPLPSINVPATAICIGGNLTLSPNTGGVWTSSDESKATVTNAGQVTAIASGNVTFTFTETVTGCSSATPTITVNALPTSVISGGGTVCSTEPLPNVSIALTGTGPWDVVYSNGTTSTSRTGISSSPYTIVGAAAGTYTVTSVSDANCTGTSMSGSALVKVNPMPTLVAGAVTSPTSCAGTNGKIAFTTTNLPDGDYQLTYTGAGSPKTVTVLSNTFTLGGLSAGVYSSFSITYNNCTATLADAQSLSDPLAPVLSIKSTSNPSTCLGNDGRIVFSTTNLPDGNHSIAFTGTGSPKTLSVAAGVGTLEGLSAGTYTNFSVSYSGCTGNLTESATLHDPSTPVLVAGAVTNPSTCSGSDGRIAFTTQQLQDGSYSLNYTGAGSPKTVNVVANGFTLSSLPAGEYSTFSITRSGCTGSDITSKTLSDPNPPTITLGAIPAICAGATSFTIPYTATTLSPVTYSVAGAGIVAETNQSLTPSLITVQLSAPASGTSMHFTLTVKNGNQCVSQPLTGTVVVRPLPTATIQGTTTVCLNAPLPTIQFTGASATSPYTFSFKLNGNSTQSITTSSGNSASLNAATNQSGVFTYTLEKVSDTYGCSQPQNGSATDTVLTKPTFTLTTQQVTLNEGNSQTFCDTDANPVNSLQFSVTNSCVVGSPVWRVQIGSGVWSDWSTTPPVSQLSNNQPHRYQAACDRTCPVTYTNPIEVTINSRASVPQNVSLAVDGVSVAAGETKEVCSLVNTTLLFAANCATDEMTLYSVDGGDYSAGVPVGLVDNQYHNYRVRCRKSNGLPSCIETESGVMRLKLVLIPSAPTVSLSSTGSCNSTASFGGQSSCGSLKTVWYNATTHIALPSLPTTVPLETTSYYARCQTENGCVSEKSNVVTFTITPTQVAPIVTVSQELVCTGTTVTISANCPAGSTTFWNTGITTPSFEVSFSNVTKQSYWAKCIFENGCQSAESIRKDIYWNAFVVTLINIGQTKSTVKTNDRSVWSSQFITRDGGPELEQSTQQNPTLYYVEHPNKIAPRYWTINVDACALGTNGSLTFDMLATPEMGTIRSFNTHENNAPYFMYANRDGWTELYAQNHPAYGFFADNGNGGNQYDEGLPKGLYKLSVRYWDKKGWGSIYPATRQAQGNVLAYQEYWFRIQSKEGVGVGAARTADSGQQSAASEEVKSKEQGANAQGSDNGKQLTDNGTFATVLPNPVSNTLRLKVQKSKGQVVQTTLRDASGRQIFSHSFQPESNTHQEEMEVANLPSGLYFLNVQTEMEQVTLKVIKIN